MAIVLGLPGAYLSEACGALSQHYGLEYADSAVISRELLQGEAYVDYDEATMRSFHHSLALTLLDLAGGRLLALDSACIGKHRDDAQFADVHERIRHYVGTGGQVIALVGDFPTLIERTGLAGRRLAAIASPRRIFFTQLSGKRPLLESLATRIIDTSGKTLNVVCSELAEALGLTRST